MNADCLNAQIFLALSLPVIKWLVFFVNVVFTLIIDVYKCPLNIPKPCKDVSIFVRSARTIKQIYLQSFAVVTEQHHG